LFLQYYQQLIYEIISSRHLSASQPPCATICTVYATPLCVDLRGY